MSVLLQEKFPVPDLDTWSTQGLDPNRAVTLYHFGPSLCSQKVRLTLHEKGVDWEERAINLTAEENLAPDYMRVNPRGVVPTLIDADNTIFDSLTIMRYIDRAFPGPALATENESAQQSIDDFLALQDEFPARELTYGNAPGPMGRVLRAKVHKRLAMLERLTRENPELADAYAVKLADTEAWIRGQESSEIAADINSRLAILLERLETQLDPGPWIGGRTYSLADIAWTTLLGRAEFVGLGPLVNDPKRPRVSAYYARLRGRPSFAAQVTRYQKKRYVLGQVLKGKFARKF